MRNNHTVAQDGNPQLPHCSTLRLVFDGKRLSMETGRSYSYSYPAVSGKPDALGRFDYSKSRQAVSWTGPIPEGTYWVTPGELWENAWWKIRSPSEGWGNFRIRIHPFSTTDTRGRSRLFIHGGARPGSAGCIDLVTNVDKFVRDLRSEIADRTKCQIHLVVRYAPNLVAKYGEK